MITLAFDSCAKIASVAVTDGERALASFNIDNGLTQSELLLPMAEAALGSLRLSFDDVGLLAVSVGPGSFTGVRIGVSLVKGLAFGKNCGVVGVSTLEALAYNLRDVDGLVLAVMDARRSQLYHAAFRCSGGRVTRLSPDEAIAKDTLSDIVKKYRENAEALYLVGDGYEVATAALCAAGVEFCKTPTDLRGESALSVARLGYITYTEGGGVSDTDIQPKYLRLPQAERERLQRQGENKNG